MEQGYWLKRGQAELAMARSAATSESRLIHYDLAGRCSVKAAIAAPFMLPSRGPVTEGERDALRLPQPLRKIVAPPARSRPGPGKSGGR